MAPVYFGAPALGEIERYLSSREWAFHNHKAASHERSMEGLGPETDSEERSLLRITEENTAKNSEYFTCTIIYNLRESGNGTERGGLAKTEGRERDGKRRVSFAETEVISGGSRKAKAERGARRSILRKEVDHVIFVPPKKKKRIYVDRLYTEDSDGNEYNGLTFQVK